MEKIYLVFFLAFSLFIVGCSKNNNVTNLPSNSTGGISFKFDHSSIPEGVVVISATLTRTNFTTITKNLNLISDSTADISIPAIQIGTWHLKVDARDNNGTILYTGETDVVVQENVVVQLNLTLNPVTSGMGAIYIFVTWGTNNSGQWIDYGGNPIITRNNNPSYPNSVASGKVILDNGTYKMWYSAIYNNAVGSIWYAESQNGINWNTIGSTPVLTASASGSWDDHGIIPSVVLKENNVYKMYYEGNNGSYELSSIGLATSTDGIHWQKYDTPVIAYNNQYYMLLLTDIVKKDSNYFAYFSYNNSISTNNNKIGLATSLDGINWTMYVGNPILAPTLTWEGGSIGYPTIVFENNRYKMVYSDLYQQEAFGMAISGDGINFTKQSTPIFSNTNAATNNARIAYPFYRKLNNEYLIYYTGVSTTGELTINLLRFLN